MHSSLISKIEKARTYAEDRGRVTISGLSAAFRGNHNTYEVGFGGDQWRCSCPFFASRGVCSHTMAMQRMLEGMVPRDSHAPTEQQLSS